MPVVRYSKYADIKNDSLVQALHNPVNELVVFKKENAGTHKFAFVFTIICSNDRRNFEGTFS